MADMTLPPLAVRVEAEPPQKFRPSLGEACILTLGYWLAMTGALAGVVLAGLAWQVVFGDAAELQEQGAGDGPLDQLPPTLHAAVAWAIPAGYLGGLLFSFLVARRIVGPGWANDLGLKRLPPHHLVLALLAWPAFSFLSDVLASSIHPIDAWIQRITGLPEMGDSGAALSQVFAGFHWSFAVLAIGLCPGVVEELWCRGFLGRGLISRHGWFLGVVFTSCFFGLLHLWPPSYVLVTAIMGAGLHFSYLASRSLWVPITLHAVNNGFAAMAAIKAVPTATMDAAMAASPTPIIAVSVALILSCGLAMWQARWRWPGETPGAAVPSLGSTAAPTHPRPRPILTAIPAVLCGVLLWLILR